MIYRKLVNAELVFCSNCGSTRFSRKQDSGKCNIRLGILDDVPSQKPAFHIFVGSKAPWEEIFDGYRSLRHRRRPADEAAVRVVWLPCSAIEQLRSGSLF